MTETVEVTSQTVLIDQFLEKHSAGLPGHIVDFALDLRSVIAELEEALAEYRYPAGV